ncbi:MAG: hypothetical protein QOF48_2564 [Verrucomicrobiota bacterium]|jgi:FkbM family methyltransferase
MEFLIPSAGSVRETLQGCKVKTGDYFDPAFKPAASFTLEMMNPLKIFSRPEYFFRPRQALLRMRRAFSGKPPAHAQVRLPWGQIIAVQPNETIGAGIWHYGIFDLIVTEAIWRLLDPGETALDIGANIGQMTSLMRHRSGERGRVLSFEPHPQLFEELSALMNSTAPISRSAPVELYPVALSDRRGEAFFDSGAAWSENRGLGKVTADGERDKAGSFKVKLDTLDDLLPHGAKVGVCKIDVEGHELKVFEGARRLLGERAIRDIIFEDLGTYPTPVHHLFQQQGYSLFALHSTSWRPRLLAASLDAAKFKMRDGANYLATLSPDRAVARFRGWGWRVLTR